MAILEDPTTPLDIRIGRIRTINVTIIDDDSKLYCFWLCC